MKNNYINIRNTTMNDQSILAHLKEMYSNHPAWTIIMAVFFALGAIQAVNFVRDLADGFQMEDLEGFID